MVGGIRVGIDKRCEFPIVQNKDVDYRSGRQGRESYGVKVPCRQLPESDG